MVNQSFNLSINGQSTMLPAIKAWEIYLKDQRKSPYTIKSFIGDIQLLASFLPLDKTITDISTNDLNRFFEWIKEGRGRNIPCSPKSFSRRITSIKSFFRWLEKFAAIHQNPAEPILQHSVISPIPEILTSIEENQVLESALKMKQVEKPDLRPYLLLKLLLETGIKKSECINLRLNHINIDAKEPYIFIRYPNAKDRNKERKVTISKEWIQALKGFLEQNPDQEVLFPWSPRRLEYILEDIGNAASLTKHLSFSMCRWTSAVNDLQIGMEAEAIRQKMGVSKIQWRELRVKMDQLLKNRT
jgi:site-specific recombinase XerD